jgi:uncharacterized membrane protein YfcA
VDLLRYVLLFVAAFLAGAVNSIAGGGSVISFPLMLWAGIAPVVANATNNVALFPGYAASANGYRDELREADPVLLRFIGPAIVGGAIGAYLLLHTPSHTFETIAPYLVLFATLLLAGQDLLAKWVKPPGTARRGRSWWTGALAADFVMSIYGGYFGAGLGILLLATLGLMGFTNLHHMNAVKAVLSMAIVAVALVYFAVRGAVLWPVGLVMAVGASLGGYYSARLARKVDQAIVRRVVVAIGLVMAISLLVRLYA